ncbi:hypothetical protein [Neisseria canis]|uniref:Lipoprotein n=1 Tax=Neisseria canis TaxID=493 RepID=A0A1X3D1A0_9NEIS|nr:hypothetical protein [Neisseria canis]OSI13491.1 hypothetical protein BWD07_00900 [Neisseria canis]VEE99620.1 Uncharacterised protein [Neisseria canis]
MKKFFFTLTTALLLSACGQNEESPAASAASNPTPPPPAAPVSSASDNWITDNGEHTNALPPAASIPHVNTPAASAPTPVPAPPPAPASPINTTAASAATPPSPTGKIAPACEALINRMSRCYDRLPDDSAAEMKATLDDVRTSLAGTDGNVCKTTMTEEFNGTAAALGCE